MLVKEGVEGVEVRGFLVVHVCHEGPEVRVSADEGWCLRGVDEGSGELAGLVHTELVKQTCKYIGQAPFFFLFVMGLPKGRSYCGR